MRTTSRLLCLLFFFCLPLFADSKNPADYPLRFHIFNVGGTTFYHNRVAEEVKGDGRANLFENGEPRAVDFSFDCGQKIRSSFGYETYPARWKNKGKELIVLFPVFGKANSYFTCNVKTDVKDYAYFASGGRLNSEPPEEFKAWMRAHDYDPEHGKNTPTPGAPPVIPARLDAARQALTGDHKDPDKAKQLLLEVVSGGLNDATPEELAWAQIYLGYIEDRAGHRDAALSCYQKALAIQGATPGTVSMARVGLRQPLTWIRHLDAPSPPPAP